MNTSEESLIDIACESFERSSQRGPAAIQDCIAKFPGSSEFQKQLRLELIMIDMDHDLRLSQEWNPTTPKVEGVLKYLCAFSDLRRDKEALRELLCYEFSCLFEMQAAPKIMTYVSKFPLVDGLSKTLSVAAQKADRSRITFETRNHSNNSMHLGFDEIEIGRQNRHESPPLTDTFKNGIRRIVFASADDKKIARQQARIRRVGHDRIRIFNMNRKSPLRVVENGSGKWVESGNELEFDLASVISVGDLIPMRIET